MNVDQDRRDFLLAGACVAAGLAMPGWLLAAAENANSPWELLFNGTDLEGWTFYQDGVGDTDRFGAVDIRDGVLEFLGPRYSAPPEAGFGYIATEKTHGNFHLRLDFMWGNTRYAPRSLAKRNSGLLYHMHPTVNKIYPPTVEFQIEESDVGDAILIDVQGIEGANLGGTPAWPSNPPGFPQTYTEPRVARGLARQWFLKKGDFERREGWNTLDLIAFDDQSAHIVNGRIVNTVYGLIKNPVEGAPKVPLTEGRIALELEGAQVFYRNVLIRKLEADDIRALKAG